MLLVTKCTIKIQFARALETKFVAVADVDWTIIYFCSLLHDLQVNQADATILYEDNHGALSMANTQQPTRNMWHLDIKHFVLLDWVEHDLINLHSVSTHANCADTFPKLLGSNFHWHYDTIMGHHIPA